MRASDTLRIDLEHVRDGTLSEYDKLMVFLEISKMILDESISDADLRRKIFERIPRGLLERALE